MIVRLWHGRVPTALAPAYRNFLTVRAVADYRAVSGNLSVQILERPEGEDTHFMTLTTWESMDAVRAFAGPDAELARYYPEDDGYLIEREPHVVHYVVVGQA